MTGKNFDLAQRMALRRGIPAAPTIAEVTTEVRTNGVIMVPPPGPDQLKYVIGTVVIEWTFRVPYHKVREFNAFLADHEALIADACEKLMRGVHYRGTYMTTHSERLEFRTYWAYDSHDAQKQWENALPKASANFSKALRRLRSYWLGDPNGTHRHFAPGALFAKGSGGAVFGLTLDAAEELEGGGMRKAARGRKTARK
jgi:hypothetical protein